ncbi:MAG TPA: IS630 family transposase, partial [Longimicrobiaceae bacterium]|nr:IS630 family transposase [Longimicrobiaceae bacterium]
HPRAKVELWANDEHRVGLIPIVRVVWVPKGERPQALVRPRYQWRYVVAFVHPESGETSFWLVPALNAVIFSALLHAFAEEHGLGERKRILLVVDQAGWHGAEAVEVPEGLTLIFLPPYSPELQPAEHLWELIDEPVANRALASLTELEAVLGRRCRLLGEQRERIRSTSFFHWWPHETHAVTN